MKTAPFECLVSKGNRQHPLDHHPEKGRVIASEAFASIGPMQDQTRSACCWTSGWCESARHMHSGPMPVQRQAVQEFGSFSAYLVFRRRLPMDGKREQESVPLYSS